MVAVFRLHEMKYSKIRQSAKFFLNQWNVRKQILTSIPSLLQTNEHNMKQIALDVVTSTS